MNFQLRHGHSGLLSADQNAPIRTAEHSHALIAHLSRRHYSSVLSLGCSPITANADLARRADRFLALDDDPRSVAAARARLICRPQARVRHTTAPKNWPRREFDLIVISEMIGRLNRFEQRELARKCAESLSDCGELILLCDLEGSARTIECISAIEEFRRSFERFRHLDITRHAHAGPILHLTITARGKMNRSSFSDIRQHA
ncbi:hypothetical protein [Paracoccus aestuariivivens]|uniref:Class I SAM-dependent methyltransferase n=1 Tax=Paracoccus aestuariivivens TaxID=1820333 RepID=A0A6L6JF90_9RHOB|nr:hypothetical protein [Paracoccus aestuariivivens]MTH79915.1 hypothetical protein [Paracoccus aestuariivivens]